jgi:lysophospholipase L1-like esterase
VDGQALGEHLDGHATAHRAVEHATGAFTQNGLVLADATIRQTVHVSVGGRQLRLRFSNAFGDAPLPLTKGVIALPDGGRAGVSRIIPRVLNDGLGPNALGRLDRDVLAQSGVRWLIIFHGVNDIGTAEATPPAQRAVAEDLIAAYDQMITRAHAQGIWVYGATLTAFGDSFYDDPQGYRETARQTVNRWIRTSGRFDDVLDFDRAVRDPADPRRLLPQFDVGDHLHMNPAGYRALAATVPIRLFRHLSVPADSGPSGPSAY